MRFPSDSRPTTLSLTVASPSEPARPEETGQVPYLPWLVAAVAWSAAVFALGWALVAVFVSAGWLTAVHTSPAEVASTIGQGWLALNGAPARLGGATVSLAPLGLTLVLVVALAVVAHHAGQQFALEPDAAPRRRATAWASVAGACVATHVTLTGIAATLVGAPSQAGAALVGGLVVAVLGAGAGAVLGLGLDPLAGLPPWARRLPRAAELGLAVLAAGSFAVLVMTLVAHWPRVVALQDSLSPDVVGSALLVLLQLAWWPTWLLWAGSFMLGAGVHVGAETLVAPGVATTGTLPAIPLLGAVPVVPGVADWAWLAVGVAAGALAGWWVVGGPGTSGTPRWLDAAWQGALGGVLPGVLWVAASWFATGDLGTHRLAGVGPRFPELLLWGTLPLAAAGALAGLAVAWWLSRRTSPDQEPGASR